MVCPDCLSSDCAFDAASNVKCDSKFVNLIWFEEIGLGAGGGNSTSIAKLFCPVFLDSIRPPCTVDRSHSKHLAWKSISGHL